MSVQENRVSAVKHLDSVEVLTASTVKKELIVNSASKIFKKEELAHLPGYIGSQLITYRAMHEGRYTEFAALIEGEEGEETVDRIAAMNLYFVDEILHFEGRSNPEIGNLDVVTATFTPHSFTTKAGEDVDTLKVIARKVKPVEESKTVSLKDILAKAKGSTVKAAANIGATVTTETQVF